MDKVKSMEEVIEENGELITFEGSRGFFVHEDNLAEALKEAGYIHKDKWKSVPMKNLFKNWCENEGYIHKNSVPRLDEDKIREVLEQYALSECIHIDYMNKLIKAISTHFQAPKCEHEELNEEELKEAIRIPITESCARLFKAHIGYVDETSSGITPYILRYAIKHAIKESTKAICQKFSKPSVKLPNRKKVVWGKERIMIKDIQYERNIGYNQAIQEVKRINNSGVFPVFNKKDVSDSSSIVNIVEPYDEVKSFIRTALESQKKALRLSEQLLDDVIFPIICNSKIYEMVPVKDSNDAYECGIEALELRNDLSKAICSLQDKRGDKDEGN